MRRRRSSRKANTLIASCEDGLKSGANELRVLEIKTPAGRDVVFTEEERRRAQAASERG